MKYLLFIALGGAGGAGAAGYVVELLLLSDVGDEGEGVRVPPREVADMPLEVGQQIAQLGLSRADLGDE